MDKKVLRIDTRWAVLESMSRLSKWGFGRSIRKNILENLKQRYGLILDDRQFFRITKFLRENGFIEKEVGRLDDMRTTVYNIAPGRAVDICLTKIELNKDEALVHNGWVGIVHDPPETTTDYNSLPFGSTMRSPPQPRQNSGGSGLIVPVVVGVGLGLGIAGLSWLIYRRSKRPSKNLQSSPGRTDVNKEIEVMVDKRYYGKCPSCGSQFDYDDKSIGMLVECWKCFLPMRLRMGQAS